MKTTTKNKDELEQEEQVIVGPNGERYVTDAPGLKEGLTLYKSNEGGSEDGHGYTALQKSYGEAPSYTNKYQNAINAAANAIMNRGAFTYDPNKDPTYQQYADSYTRQGQQAMQDTLAQVSARTGGLASSYAASASQQAYNNYMSALADKVPELRQLAYQMYLNEGDDLRQNMQMLQGLEQTDYGRYLNDLDQYNANRKFDYEKDLKARQDAQAQVQDHIAAGGKAGDLPEELITASGYSPAQLAAWEKVFADEQNLAAAKLMEGTGDYSRYKELYGMTDEEVAAMVKRDQQQNAPKLTGGGDNPSMTLSTAKAMAQQGQFTDEVLRVLRNAGFNDEYLRLEYGYDPQNPVESIGGAKTSLGWDEDEGIFTWNGKSYHDVEALLSDIDKAGLSEREMEALKSKFARYGFNLS